MTSYGLQATECYPEWSGEAHDFDKPSNTDFISYPAWSSAANNPARCLARHRGETVSWAAEEMATVDLGDQRLNRRAASLLESMATKPDSSIPAQTEGLAEMTAAYRFFSNERIDEHKLLEPHRVKTVERMQNERVVLCVEDTTQIDYTGHPGTSGLGTLYKDFCRGLFLHPMLAVTPAGVCLGVLDAKFYARPEDRPAMSAGAKAKRKIEEKESYRWLDGYLAMNALAQTSAAQLIYVADRESDIEDVLAAAQGQRGHILLRARHDRLLEDGERMWETVRNSPIVGIQEFEMAARPGHSARTVHQTLRSMTIELPETRKRAHAITINVVIAHEENPPQGEESVSWTLLTTLPTKTIAEIKRVIDYYRTRWVIEVYFKVLKTGCAIEKLQLETAERLKVAITLYMIVAYRVLFMVNAGRESPNIPCDSIFEDEEWKTIYMASKKKRPPQEVPRLIDIVVMVAKFGGFKGRKCDGFPGAKAVWSGLSIIRGYLIVNEHMKTMNNVT